MSNFCVVASSSMMLRCVKVKQAASVDSIASNAQDKLGWITRLAPHIPSSPRAGKRKYCHHIHYCTMSFGQIWAMQAPITIKTTGEIALMMAVLSASPADGFVYISIHGDQNCTHRTTLRSSKPCALPVSLTCPSYLAAYPLSTKRCAPSAKRL